MSVLDIFQWVINISFFAGLTVCFVRLKKPPKDDPRLSRGLQLLQSKISVLEDLSDRTEVQVDQMTKLLEVKTGQIQSKIQQAEKQIRKIEVSMDKSRQVASIFQDKIPHDEIVERKNTIKYVQAARLAHQGNSIETIVKKLGIPRAEAEFISKVNKDELMFDEAQLPEWANVPAQVSAKSVAASAPQSDIELVVDDDEEWTMQETKSSEESQVSQVELPTMSSAQQTAAAAADFSRAFGVPDDDYSSSLKQIGEQFRQACAEFDEVQEEGQVREEQLEQNKQIIENAPSQLFQAASLVTNKIVNSASELLDSTVAAQTNPSDLERNESKETVEVTPSNYARNEMSAFSGKSKVVDKSEVLKVKFPSVDLNDNLT